jgi:predicted AlkP superfamily pyrophosphatase or phosphodiesterase
MTVILTMIDGLRPDVFDVIELPALSRLKACGAYTLRASSVMPSVTLPCHMSIFHSVPPTRHGVTTNDWSPMARPVPGLVDIASAAGLRCVAYYNWEPLRNLSLPGSLYCSYFINNEREPGGDGVIGEQAARAITDQRPDFAFIYFASVDIAGHDFGWMSAGYLAQVTYVDGVLGRLLDALAPLTCTVLVQADHGGHERSHGTDDPRDMTIPWLISGPGIRQNHAIQAAVSLLDTAPTLARLLGLRPHPIWEGRVVEEVLL